MTRPYLEMTFRKGKPFAAYLYLDRRMDDRVARTVPMQSLLVDYAEDGRILGIEIPSPTKASVQAVASVLETLHVTNVAIGELQPLAAA